MKKEKVCQLIEIFKRDIKKLMQSSNYTVRDILYISEIPLNSFIYKIHDTEYFSLESIYEDSSGDVVSGFIKLGVPKYILECEREFIYALYSEDIIFIEEVDEEELDIKIRMNKLFLFYINSFINYFNFFHKIS